VGAALALVFVVSLSHRAIRHIDRTPESPLGRLAVAMIVMLIMVNAMESSFLERNDRLWCLTA
jgi:hypothetical protein